MTRWRIDIKDPGRPERTYRPLPPTWQEWLNRYIAAPDIWLIESIEPGRIVFVGRRRDHKGSTATFTYGPVP